MSNTPEYNKQYYLKNQKKLRKAHLKNYFENKKYYLEYRKKKRQEQLS